MCVCACVFHFSFLISQKYQNIKYLKKGQKNISGLNMFGFSLFSWINLWPSSLNDSFTTANRSGERWYNRWTFSETFSIIKTTQISLNGLGERWRISRPLPQTANHLICHSQTGKNDHPVKVFHRRMSTFHIVPCGSAVLRCSNVWFTWVERDKQKPVNTRTQWRLGNLNDFLERVARCVSCCLAYHSQMIHFPFITFCCSSHEDRRYISVNKEFNHIFWGVLLSDKPAVTFQLTPGHVTKRRVPADMHISFIFADSFAEFIVLKATFSLKQQQMSTAWIDCILPPAPVSPASSNTGSTSCISIYKLLLSQPWDSRFNRTWIYSNARSHYACDSQMLQTVSFTGSFAIELHNVWCLIGRFDIYIASTVALTGQSCSRLRSLPCQLFYFPHFELLTEPQWHHDRDCQTKLAMSWWSWELTGVSMCNLWKNGNRIESVGDLSRLSLHEHILVVL